MEHSTVVLDSNVFVAFYNQSDSSHEEAIRVMAEFDESTIVVHPYVIQEVSTVLTYRFGLAMAKKFVQNIMEASNITIPVIDIQADLTAFSRLNSKISFTDLALINLAKRTNALLVTFDRQMIALFRKK